MADPARDWDGDGALSSRDDEWVEIINLGKAAVDLAGYRLSDGEGRPVWRYGFSGVLEAGAVRDRVRERFEGLGGGERFLRLRAQPE